MLILSKKEQPSKTSRTQQTPPTPRNEAQVWMQPSKAGSLRGDLQDLISSCLPGNLSSRWGCLDSCPPFWSGPSYTLSSARNPAFASQVAAPQSEEIVRARSDGRGQR